MKDVQSWWPPNPYEGSDPDDHEFALVNLMMWITNLLSEIDTKLENLNYLQDIVSVMKNET